MGVFGLVRDWTFGTGAVLAALAVGGCAFVLDFDKYEACAECEAVDVCVTPNHACVRNGCVRPKGDAECAASDTSGRDPLDASQPRCADGARLSPYQTLEALEADVVLQAEVLTTSTRIYHAAFISEDGRRDVVLRAFDTTDVGDDSASPIATLRLSTLLEEALSNGPDAPPDEIVAPVSMVATPDAPGSLTLYTAIAAPGAMTGDVVQIRLDATWPQRATPTLLTDMPNFHVNDSAGRAGPAAGTLADGAPFVVWQGCRPTEETPTIEKDLCRVMSVTSGAGAIYGHSGSSLLEKEDLIVQGVSEDLPASSIRALGGGNQPAAVWAVSDLSGEQLQVRAGVPGPQASVSTELLQCDPATGSAQWLNATPIWGPVSSVGWTKDDSATSEATKVQCLDDSCRDLAASVDAGATATCSTAMTNKRVFLDVTYLVHGIWADSTADKNAYTVAAFVRRTGSERRLQATVTQGLPDPNEHPLIAPQGEFELATSNPTKVVLSLQRYEPKAERAVVAVGWVEPTEGARQAARLSALDLCLSP